MRTFLVFLFSCLLLTSCATPPGPPTRLERANVLPLALNDRYQFRKVKMLLNNYESQWVRTQSETVNFERARMNFGAVNRYDVEQRFGNYYDFFWRTSDTADVTVRFEYRQASTGNFVMAMERYYPGAHGSYKSTFNIIGDDYLERGIVTSWRVVLIVDGRIVALKQSFMWQ